MFLDDMTTGPDDERGLFGWFDDGSLNSLPPLNPRDASITWRPAAPDIGQAPGRFYLGVVSGSIPAPADLRRARPLQGFVVKLADGHDWSIPVAATLPKRLCLDHATGEQRRIVEAAHREFWKESRIFDDLFRSHAQAGAVELLAAVVHHDQAPAFAVSALAKNYRLTRDLVDVLGLLDDESLFWTIAATIGMPTPAQLAIARETRGGGAITPQQTPAQFSQ
jgi:hypothetical protein